MGPTVLIVDDEPLIRMDVASLLEDAGFDVIEAVNADEAIRVLETKSSVWAIFTDVDMPGSMDGIRLAHAVKDRWPPVHIFVMSGHRSVDVSELPAGGRFFSKPCDHVAVIAAFRHLQAGSQGKATPLR
jgi:DNA-binding NtrC family response regulator